MKNVQKQVELMSDIDQAFEKLLDVVNDSNRILENQYIAELYDILKSDYIDYFDPLYKKAQISFEEEEDCVWSDQYWYFELT